MRALARVLWLFFNSREVHFGEEFYPTDDVVCFISPKTVFKQLKQDLLGQVSRLRKREEQTPPLE
jgi:hypothetical protein